MSQIVDFHNHLMPAVDDGAQSMEESMSALDAYASCEVRSVITTPHFDGSLTLDPEAAEQRMAELDAAWAALQKEAAKQPVALYRGVELMLDTPEPDLRDRRLRL